MSAHALDLAREKARELRRLREEVTRLRAENERLRAAPPQPAVTDEMVEIAADAANALYKADMGLPPVSMAQMRAALVAAMGAKR